MKRGTTKMKYNPSLLHADISHSSHGALREWLLGFGSIGEFIDSVIIHAFLETLIILPLLFLTYLFMEYIEHKASKKVEDVMKKSGPLGTLGGALFGALPQCGFSAVAANLYTGRVVSLGTMIAVFLSTSDEMLPIMISGAVGPRNITLIIVYKILIAILCGFAVDLVLKLAGKGKKDIDIDQICDNDNCHCERGILASAIHHTVSVSLFILGVSILLNGVIFFVGEEGLGSILPNLPVVSHFVSAVLGLIPNCAVSVGFTKLALGGFISVGSMLAALFSGAGVGLLVLFRLNKHLKENLLIIGILVFFGTLFGLIADFIPFLSLS